MKLFQTTAVILCTLCSFCQHIFAQNAMRVPLAGNTFFSNNLQTSDIKLTQTGIGSWKNSHIEPAIYFRPGQPGTFKISLIAKTNGKSKIQLSTNGQVTAIGIVGNTFKEYAAGSITVTDTGYISVQLKGLSKTGNSFADVSHLVLQNIPDTTKARFVKDDFYWGRRGPSVHLNYPLPAEKDIEYFYNELTVPVGSDPVGSYYMSNGFGEGYGGIQVNSPTERRILFSVWAPFTTDDPKSIPDSLRIKLIKQGNGVHIGEFGNEGSGGQSYLKYNWKAGNTYSFLTRIRPDDKGNTEYTSWFFAPEKNKWLLIACFSRPKTNTWYKRPHSFLENFDPEMGNINRLVYAGNQWACDKDGNWIELTSAGFTADATARKQARMDYAGGEKNGQFYMTNCGFFKDFTPIGSKFTRVATGKQPKIDFSALP
jgi:hypothetical protein